MKKILVPLDGSKYSFKALEKARMFCEKFGSELIVMTVVSDIVALNVDYKIDIISQNIASAEQMLKQVELDFKDSNIKLTTLYKVGDITREIVEQAEKNDVDLIVMGSRGLGVLSRTFLGSISHKVLNNTDKSVLVVK
ncbi:universal stress family protein [Peptostreptococcaceae bacterium AS15]|nr:universal stress family protein [[Eubacterium] yurii subsp. margaretiae ATCC 43715]EJP23255.1 universal stress family protein [Peptostreptococcaceae bacterium AS15]